MTFQDSTLTNELFFTFQKHGGSDNGQTEFETTVFIFDIQEQHVKRGMDIFSQFFVSPLIKKEAIFRERKAVNSGEHGKTISAY